MGSAGTEKTKRGTSPLSTALDEVPLEGLRGKDYQRGLRDGSELGTQESYGRMSLADRDGETIHSGEGKRRVFNDSPPEVIKPGEGKRRAQRRTKGQVNPGGVSEKSDPISSCA